MFANILSAGRALNPVASGRRSGRRLRLEPLEDRIVLSAPPAAPVFTATAVSSSQITLSWHAAAGATSYQIEEAVSGAWIQLGNVGAATAVTITGLTAGKTYDFDVVASNAAGSAWGSQLLISTPSALPAAPVFTAKALSSSQVSFSWNAVAGATTYQIEEVVNGAWKQVGTVGNGTTSFTVTGLSAKTAYDFDVVATNAAGSTWGTQQYATTSAAAAAGGTTTTSINHPTAATAYTAVSGNLYSGPNGPSFLDVQQGSVGDCWLLASLAEVAARNPYDIETMFTYAGTAVESGVTVTLYNVRLYNPSGQAEYYTVDTELPSGGGYYDHPANGALWVALIEKAYAQANGARMVTTQFEGSDSYAALNGGSPAWALEAITGKAAGSYSINPSNAAVALNAGQFVVLGSSPSPASQYIVGDSTGTHAYAIVGYNAASSSSFEVYNPWGTLASGLSPYMFDGHQVYGLFWATAAFLSQNFVSQSIGSADAPDAGGSGSAGASSVTAAAPSQGGDLILAQDSATPAVGTIDTGNATPPAAGGSSADSLLASFGTSGRAAQPAGESAGEWGGQHSDVSAIDAFWIDAGDPEFPGFLPCPVFTPRR